MALFSGLLRWHENAEKRRREKSGFVRFPGLLATACRPLATVGLLSSGSVLFSTPSLLEIYVAARHVPHRNDTNIPWEREPPNNLHADGLTDIDIEEDEDTRKASSFVVLSTGTSTAKMDLDTADLRVGGNIDVGSSGNGEGMAYDDTKELAETSSAGADTFAARRTHLQQLQSAQHGDDVSMGNFIQLQEEAYKNVQDLLVHGEEGKDGLGQRAVEAQAALAEHLRSANRGQGRQAAEAMQRTSGLSPGGIEDQMQKLREAVDGMARLLQAGGNLHAVAGLDADLRRLEAMNGATIYDSTDGATSRIAIVPIIWEDNALAPGANWDFPFLQVDSSTSSSSKVAILKTVQFVQIPEGELSAQLPWRSYYRVAFDGMSEVGAPWRGDWPSQANFLDDAKLFRAMCQYGYDVSVSLQSDQTNRRIKSNRRYWWNEVENIENAEKHEKLFGGAENFRTQIHDGRKKISIKSITACEGDYELPSVDPCTTRLRGTYGETIEATLRKHLNDNRINKEGTHTQQKTTPLVYKVECAAERINGHMEVFRNVFVEFWSRKLA
ncbi:unnamed protein product [Amoebophrya sp. A25]|nr:unnamed protein product [Amoebophrya sp. A25]|eukprot:GSA25T00019873001.1